MLSFAAPLCDTSALEMAKRNKACIFKTAGIEVHLLLHKDLCQTHKRDANLLWWTGPPTSPCCYDWPHALKTLTARIFTVEWQSDNWVCLMSFIVTKKELKIAPNSSAKEYLFHIIFPLSLWSVQ